MEVSRLIERMKRSLAARGARGPTGLQRLFKSMDHDGNGALDYEEFTLAMKDLNLALTNQDIRTLFMFFDSDNSRCVEYAEFVHHLCGKLSPEREKVVRAVFRQMDTDGDGIVSISDLGSNIQLKGHPMVEDGSMTPLELMSEMLLSLEDSGCAPNGKITEDKLCEYFQLSASFMDDAFFYRLMTNMWGAPVSVVPKSIGAQSTTRVLQTLGDAMTVETGVESVVAELRAELARRGARGIVGLSRKFRIMDDNGSRSLDMDEFSKAMKECAMDLTKEELNSLFKHFDQDRNGTIDYEEFLYTLRGELNARRRDLVDKAFTKLDRSGKGVVEPRDVVHMYDASQHPAVLQGRKTEEEVLQDFLETFDVGGEKDGKVTRNEFTNYYKNISMSVDDDDYFELMIRNAWHISGGEGWCANTANRRVLVTHQDGSQTVEEIQDDLGVSATDTATMLQRLQSQGIDAVHASVFGEAGDTGPGQRPKRSWQQRKVGSIGATAQSATPSSSRGGAATADAATTSPVPRSLSSYRHSEASIKIQDQATEQEKLVAAKGGSRTARFQATSSHSELDPGVASIVQRLRSILKSRGSQGIAGFSRRFHIMDKDKNGTLSMAEFKRGLNHLRIDLGDADLRRLFMYFDKDHTGVINSEEFFCGVREELNARRLALVDLAFAVLDVDGSGTIEPAEVSQRYDASRHPEVIQGRKTPDEVYAEFLENFEAGGQVDGYVTLSEFRSYYTSISACIDDDDYFELMIRNVWHISGGEGWCGNTANRRLLVIHKDGTQSVEEIKNDLGLDMSDTAAVLRRLRRQGVDAVQVSLFDGMDTASGSARKTAPPQSLVDRRAVARQTVKPLRAQLVSAQGAHAGDESPYAAADGDLDERIAARGPRPAAAARLGSLSAIEPTSKSGPQNSFAARSISPGTAVLIQKVKNTLARRGARGFIGLQRKFRVMDDDESKSLSLSEFKKGLVESGLELEDRDFRAVFNAIDRNGDGYISFEEFIQGLRNPLTPRRLELVRLAFAKLDKDGNGIIEPKELLDMYDSSRHPEVIAGRKTPEQVLSEFLETFDVGGEVDGKVTKQEFVNYYTNIGASIDDDDYFELMMRNAWHISGGTGWCENSSNKRVLVTHSDGTQTVQEIKDDLGLKPGDVQGLMRRLRRQGVDVVQVSEFGGLDTADRPGGGGAGNVTGAGAEQVFGIASRQALRSRLKKVGFTNALASAPAGILPGSQGGEQVLVKKPGTVGFGSKAKASGNRMPSVGVAKTIALLKNQLMTRGARGFVGLQRKFRQIDQDGNKALTRSELKYGLADLQLKLTDRELDDLMAHFDTDHNGCIGFDEFLVGIRPAMNDRRSELVGRAFARLDLDGNGIVEPTELVGRYDASKHPEVIAGRMTEEQVLEEFLETFDVGGVVDGKVTKEEFKNYYSNISASIDDDDYFELMMRNSWHISGGQGWCANTANKRVLVTHGDGTQTVQEIKDDLGLAPNDTKEMIRRLQRQGVDVVNVSSFDATETKNSGGRVPAKESKPMSLGRHARTTRWAAEQIPDVVAGQTVEDRSLLTYGSGGLAASMSDVLTVEPSVNRSPRKPRSAVPKQPSELGPETKLQLEKLRQALLLHGAHGIHGLARKFRTMDDNRSGTLDLAEFKIGISEAGGGLSDREMRQLFHFFDADESGTVTLDEFMTALAPPMAPRRLALVGQAFNVLDSDGNGYIDAGDVVSKYDASQHPAVLEGKKSQAQVLDEFLSNFEVGGEKDGKVSLDEFRRYYQRLSASIDNDDYFELMMRNAWHLSGGEGWCANTANKRVLVTHKDGTQTVEEIQDDLGLSPDDSHEMLRRLRQQGIDAVNVSSFGGLDTRGPTPKTFSDMQSREAAGSKHGIMRGEHLRAQQKGQRRVRTNPALTSQISFGGYGQPETRTSQGLSFAKKRAYTMKDMTRSSLGAGLVERQADAPVDHGATLSTVMDKVRSQLNERGARGIIGLGRRFRIMDDDGSGTLTWDEFDLGLKDMGLDLAPAELRVLFSSLDKDGSGTISFDELLQGLRGELSHRRRSLVDLAFAVLDKNGTGIVEPRDIMGVYDATAHPDVQAGKRTANEVLQEFLDTFDVGGVVDGKVTKQEFANYYANISASIDDDDYFELMMRNAWHISGGEGWCANTANKRVLVTHKDGTQSVREVKDDLGVRAGDTDEIVRRLRSQGEDAQTVSLFGGGDKDKMNHIRPASAGAIPPRRPVSRNFQTTFTLS